MEMALGKRMTWKKASEGKLGKSAHGGEKYLGVWCGGKLYFAGF